MKIKMIQTKKAAADPSGTRAMTYEAGKEYDVHEELAQVFIREGWAKENKEKKGPEENKDLAGSEEDKELKSPEETKEEAEEPIEEETKPKKEETKKKK